MRYELYALPDQTGTVGIGPSQISVVAPAITPDAPFNVTSVAAGSWLDNTQNFGPAAAPGSDFHALGSLGAPVDFTAGVEELILFFTIPGGCIDGLRLYINGSDPISIDPGLAGQDYTNIIDAIAPFPVIPGSSGFYNAYVGNFDNAGTSCSTLNALTAMNDQFSAPSETDLGLDVLANDNFGAEGPGSFTIISGPGADGTAVIDNNGTPNDITDDFIVFTSAPGFLGVTALTYEICDAIGNCDQATATIDVFDAAMCVAPINLNVDYLCDGAVVLSWDPVPVALSYTLAVEDVNGNPVVNFVNMASTSVTIVAGTLDPGEDYNFAVTANCGASDVSSATGQIEGSDIQDRQPTISITNVNNPVCPDDEFSGSFDVTVNDNCGATYDITVAGSTQTAAAGSTVTFGSLNAAVGGTDYTVNLSLASAGGCQFNTDQTGCVSSVSATQTLTPSDSQAPTVEVTADGGIDLGSGATLTYTPPEGECGVQLLWSVFPSDNCSSPSEIDFTASVTNPNLGVFPTASITQDAVDAAYAVNIFAAVGTNTVTLSATDENGNNTTLTFTIEVLDVRVPEIYGPGDMQVQIPACQDEGIPVNWTVSTVDDCDIQPTLTQTAGPTSGSTLTAGTYTVSYTSTDDTGNTANYSFTIEVTQAASPAPIVDVSGNGQFHVPACEDNVEVVFSGNVYDCDLLPFNFNPADLTVTGADVAISYFLPQEDYVYFEATGDLEPGDYLIVVSY
ncbi:MAG: HYR domain-containing protein, partial [bacterium]|nr:HYR domain-containing protein [bacterium]